MSQLFILKRPGKPNLFYVGMIAGLITNVSQIRALAKRFDSHDQAQAELERYASYFKGQFEIETVVDK